MVKKAKSKVNKNQFCMAWFAGKHGPGTDRATLLRLAKWPPGSIITISFLDGDASVQDRVKEAARGWLGPDLARLTFSFRNTTNTMIRISFRYDGSWSTIGTTCRQVPVDEPTMNFGWLTKRSRDEEVQQVVLHEFGHALGLIHEHQSPAGGIKWNKPVIYEELSGPPNNWTKKQIDENMFEAYKKKETNFTKLDPASIMMYPFPASWTTDGFSTGINSELSATDRKFIHKIYPP